MHYGINPGKSLTYDGREARMKRRILFGLLLTSVGLIAVLLSFPGSCLAASFDCSKASSEVEKIICGDDELSRLDESLNEAYLKALKATDVKAQMIKSQRQWLKNERNKCQDAECLKGVYETRIRELSGLALPGSAGATEPVSGTYSSSYPIRDWGAEGEIYRLAESKMSLSMKDKDTFEFDVIIVGGNFHICQLSGLAVRRGRFFEFRGEKELFDSPDDCILKFWFQGNSVRLQDYTGNCRAVCGQRADFSGAVLYRDVMREDKPATVTVFYLDENYHPVVKLERLGSMSDAMRAILAVYALENGAGCSGGTENISCSLTNSLNLGGQCSREHINLIRTWFKQGIPKMSGYADRMYRNIQTRGDLESICYKMPDGATFQENWDIIRVTLNGNHVIVDAHGTWLAREKTGTFRYVTEYRINCNS